MGQWSTFYLYLVLYAVTVNLQENLLCLFEFGNDCFLQLFHHREESANQSTDSVKVDGQALQNRRTLGDVVVMSIVNIVC